MTTKKLAWIVVLVALGVLLVKYHLDENAKSEAETAKTKRVEMETKTAVTQMVTRYSAIANWEKKLRDDGHQYSPILSIELERLWLVERPILYVGVIEDVSTADKDSYQLLLKRGIFSFDGFSTELQLSLHAPMKVMDSFFQMHPKLFREPYFGLGRGVAVIAQINAITSTHEQDKDGSDRKIRTGIGDLIDIVYTGRVSFFTPWK